MSFLRTADEKPIPAKGWLALALYAAGVALVLRACVYVPPAGAAATENLGLDTAHSKSPRRLREERPHAQ